MQSARLRARAWHVNVQGRVRALSTNARLKVGGCLLCAQLLVVDGRRRALFTIINCLMCFLATA